MSLPMREHIQIRETVAAEMPRDLLLQADPSTARVNACLHNARCFVGEIDADIVGVYLLQATAPEVWELMNISVHAAFQMQGVGSAMLRHAIATAGAAGAIRLEVGTGSFGYQLGFYQRHGFRVTAIAQDFFLTHYDEPIHEDGIQLKDMLRLTLELR